MHKVALVRGRGQTYHNYSTNDILYKFYYQDTRIKLQVQPVVWNCNREGKLFLTKLILFWDYTSCL